MKKNAQIARLLLCLGFFSPQIFADNNTITFPHACEKGTQIVIAAMGDLLFHHHLQVKASKDGYESLWQEAVPYIKGADIAYANLEGPIAVGMNNMGHQVKDPMRWDFGVYTDYPSFNYHPRLAKDLKTSGFTVVSTANNHTLDRSSIGVDKTIEILDQTGVSHVGSKKRDAEQSWVKIIDSKGIKVAWLACTEHTNGHADKAKQILHCYQSNDRQLIKKTIQELQSKVDAIIVSPHWGVEYQEQPNRTQQEFAKEVLNAGATAVIGSHPHVLQPVQKYITQDGRATLIGYSLGNFVSFQGSTRTRSTIILMLGLTKTANGTIINGVRYVPMYMVNRNGVENIHLMRLNAEHRHWAAFQHITKSIPEGNALFSLPIITNPECR